MVHIIGPKHVPKAINPMARPIILKYLQDVNIQLLLTIWHSNIDLKKSQLKYSCTCMEGLNVMEENNVLLSQRTTYHQGLCILMYLKKGGQKTITQKKLQSSRVSIAISNFGDFNQVRENMFSIVRVLLFDVISCNHLKDL